MLVFNPDGSLNKQNKPSTTGGGLIDWDKEFKQSQARQKFMQAREQMAKSEAERKKAEEAQKRKLEGQIAEQNSFGNQAGRVLGAIGEGIAAPYARIGQGFAEVINEATGGAQRERDLLKQRQADDITIIRQLGEKIRNAKTDEERQRFRTALRNIVTQSDAQDVTDIARQNQIAERTDPVKGAAAVGQVGLDILTAGTASNLLRGGRAAQAVGRIIAPRGALQGAASGAAVGGLYGITGTAIDKGANADLADYGFGFGAGALTGGAVGGALGSVGTISRSIQTGRLAQPGTPKNPLQKLDEAVSLAGKKAADKFYTTTPGQKVKAALTTFQSKIQSSAAPIYRQLNELQTSGRLTENQVKNVKSLIQTSRFSAQTLANDFLQKDESANRLLAPLNNKLVAGRTKEQLSSYINARNELNLIEIDKKRGAKINPAREAAFRKTVAELETPEFQARFDADVEVNRKLTDLLVEEGLVSPQQRDAWRKSNTEYIRIQRFLEDRSEIRGTGTGGKVSRGSTTAEQKRRGSTKEALDALETVVDRTNRVFAEVTSNRAANAYIDALREAGALGKQIRSAENVAARQDLRDALRFSRPLKNQLTRFEGSQLQYVRRIQNELEKLNRAGLSASLARPLPDPTLAGKLADPGAKMTKSELRSVLDNIVENTDTRILKSIRKQIARREPKLAKALDELQDIQSVLKGVNAERLNQFNELAKLADEKVRNRPTIQRMVNGTKEIYETTPEIEAAAKGFGPVYMGTLGRVISAPVRFLQTTITGGLNPAWVATALPRDFIEGLVMSRRAAQTHNPANIYSSIRDAARLPKNDNELWQAFMSYERGSSSIIDLTRGAKSNAQAIRELSRQKMPLIKKGAEVIKRPGDFYQAIQDSAKWNEQLTKYQNFRGNYNKLIKEGVDQEQAFNIALYEGRNATGNLLEQGDWTRALAAVFPYFNPTIQGGATLIRNLAERPVSTSAKIVTAVQIPAVIATAWNMSDPRRAEAYLDISPEERERYTVIVLPGSEKTDGKWQVVKIPKAPGVGGFANPIERMMVGMYGQDPGRFEKEWQSIIKAFGSPIDPGSWNQAVGSIIPFQLKPIIEGQANFDFYSGREIVPDWLKEENPDEPFKQAFPQTSSTFKKLGAALGISPLIIQNMAGDTTGEFGRNAVWLSDVAQDLAGVSEQGSEVGGRSPLESVTRAYAGAFGGERQREAREEINTVFNRKNDVSSSVTEALSQGNREEASRIAREYNQKIDRVKEFIDKNRRTVELSEKQIKALENNRFPMEGDSLSLSSIRARLRSLQE